jgi:DNA-binding MltR family transcriptional regulator
MSRASGSRRSLAKLIREHPNLGEVFRLLAYDMDDRSAAIIKAADVEMALEGALAHRMVIDNEVDLKEVFVGESAPLGSLSAKIKVGYAFGLLRDNTRAELNRIRAIRNVFAHARRPIQFSTPEVATACASLITPDRIERPHWSHYDASAPWPPADPRQRYIRTTEAIAAALTITTFDLGPDERPRPMEVPDLD